MVAEFSQVAKLRYVVFCALATALAFMAQGVYVLVTGFNSPSFGRRRPSARPMGLLGRLWSGLIPLCPGLVILALLISGAAHRHVPPLTIPQWLRMHSGFLAGVFFLGGPAVWYLTHPERMVKGLEDSNQIAFNDREREQASRMVKLICGVLLGMAVIMLAMILAAPPGVS